MLRKCMSLSRETRLTVASFMDCVGNIMLIKILSCLNLLTEVPRLTGTHQYSQFTLLRAVNNPNGSDRFFEILVGLFILTSNMGKEEMSACV